MPRVLATLIASALAAALLLSSPARADSANEARYHARRAQRFYQAGRYEDAIRAYFALARLTDSPQVAFNLGLCFDALGRDDQAFFHFSSFLEAEEISAKRRAYAEAAVKRLGPRIARIEVTSDPPGADVLLDEEAHGPYGQTPLVLPTRPGRHTVYFRKPGHAPAEVEVRAARGRLAKASARLVPVTGRLVVRSTPVEAELLLTRPDGAEVLRGRTPFDGPVPPGVFVLESSADGFRTNQTAVEVRADETTTKDVGLAALPPAQAELTVTANPVGALVEVDGRPVGFAPLIVDELRLGDRRLRLSYEGREPWEGDVRVDDEGRGFLTAVLEPPPRRTPSVATWIAGGVGAAALTAGIVTGILALNTSDAFDEARRTGSGDAPALKDQGQALVTSTDILIPVGIGGLVSATILYFTTSKTRGQPSRADVRWAE